MAIGTHFGVHEEAVEDLSRAIAFEPGNPEVLTLRGQAYLANKNPASAIKDFTRAIELDPRSVPAHLGRALASLKAEAFDEAEADVTRALELDPRSALAFAYRALVYKATAQPDLGAKEIDKAMRLEPERPEVLWAKGERVRAQSLPGVAQHKTVIRRAHSPALAQPFNPSLRRARSGQIFVQKRGKFR